MGGTHRSGGAHRLGPLHGTTLQIRAAAQDANRRSRYGTKSPSVQN